MLGRGAPPLWDPLSGNSIWPLHVGHSRAEATLQVRGGAPRCARLLEHIEARICRGRDAHRRPRRVVREGGSSADFVRTGLTSVACRAGAACCIEQQALAVMGPVRQQRRALPPVLRSHHRRRAHIEATRGDVEWCMLKLSKVDVRQTQDAIAGKGTPLEGAHAMPSRATIFRICKRFRSTGLVTAQRRCGPMLSLTGYAVFDGLTWRACGAGARSRGASAIARV